VIALRWRSGEDSGEDIKTKVNMNDNNRGGENDNRRRDTLAYRNIEEGCEAR